MSTSGQSWPTCVGWGSPASCSSPAAAWSSPCNAGRPPQSSRPAGQLWWSPRHGPRYDPTPWNRTGSEQWPHGAAGCRGGRRIAPVACGEWWRGRRGRNLGRGRGTEKVTIGIESSDVTFAKRSGPLVHLYCNTGSSLTDCSSSIATSESK